MSKPNTPTNGLVSAVVSFVKNNKVISTGMAVVALAVLSGVAFGAFSSSSPTIAPTPAPTTTPPSQTKPDTTEPTAEPDTDPVVAYVRKKTTTPTPAPTPAPPPTPAPACPIVTSVTLADIATFGIYDSYGSTGWLLNGDTTILLCQVLEITAGQTLLPNNFTLSNNGTINIGGTLRNTTEGLNNIFINIFGYNYRGITINNGTINVFSTGTITASVAPWGNSATFTNNGIVNNYGNFYFQTGAVVNNNSGGRINNYSADSGGNGGFRVNSGGVLNNIGVFINNTGATIVTGWGPGGDNPQYNNGTIYNNNGGIITNNGTINNSGIINNANGTSTCGVGTFTDTGTIVNAGTIGTACPI